MIKLLFIIVLVYSCSSSKPEDLKSKDYSYTFNQSGWKDIDSQGADKAYLNENNGSIIMLNSLCKKYDSTGLDVLSNNFLSGITRLEILEKKSVTYKDRAAYTLLSQGKLDGVTVYLNTLTMHRNHCTYDFALISPVKVNETDLKTYQNLLDKIKFE